jgi:hypothetical protein
VRLFRRCGYHHHGYQARAEAGHGVERRVIKGRGGKWREERRGKRREERRGKRREERRGKWREERRGEGRGGRKACRET